MRPDRPEVAVGLLLSNPPEERLELWRAAQERQVRQLAGELRVAERGMDLLMARLAQRHLLELRPALLPGREVVLRDKPGGNGAAAEVADVNLVSLAVDHVGEL